MTNPFKITIYSDGAQLEKMKASLATGFVSGFTTNPSLMKAAGITDYWAFAKEAVATFPDSPLSFEVFADDSATMKKEALKLTELGENVFVKIPVLNTAGESSGPLIKELSEAGVQLNITAITTTAQVKDAVENFAANTTNLVSIFVGRLNDVGIDTTAFVKESRKLCDTKPGSLLLWASTREVWNIFEAEKQGCDIITVPPGIIDKLAKLGTTAEEVALDTVKTFQKDIDDLGFSIL
ncbi:transaldolase [Enterococcus sp. AZ103]|uniref:transaldolase n=1 Tax=Enterococcus sp. AZ103 TaxID=2774628 RepID=UPI003F25A28D